MANSNKDSLGNNILYTSSSGDTQKYLNRMKEVRRTQQESFGSKKIDINDFILSPEGWETAMFCIYFLLIPYVTGAVFLFLFIAHASVTNFFVLDFSAFFIVWTIGYETIAALLLISIFISYLNYMRKPSHKEVRK